MSYSRYFSPAQVESDQKDLIISQLKADIFELKKNEQECFELSQQIKSLEAKYQSLYEENQRNDAEFKARNEANLKTIANLKSELENLKALARERNLELQELQNDNASLQELAEQKNFEISKIKKEISNGMDENNRLGEDTKRAQNQLNSMKDEKRKILGDLEGLSSDIEDLIYKNEELEKIIKNLDNENNQIERSVSQLNSAKSSLENELRNKNETLKNLDKQIGEAEKTAKGLDRDLIEMDKINEKVKSDVFQSQKQLHNEINKNQELSSRILNLENVLKSRDNQMNDAQRDLNSLKIENTEIYEENNKLNYDLDALKKHIELINELNNLIIEELERFCEQDEAVRVILNRKSRIKDLRMKAESTSKKTVLRVTEVTKKISSPVKKSPMKTIKKVPEYSKY